MGRDIVVMLAVLSDGGKAVGIVKIKVEVAVVEAGMQAVKVGTSVEGSKVSNSEGVVEVLEVVEVAVMRKVVMIGL